MITNGWVAGLVAVIFGFFLGLCVFSYLYTTLQGKFVWWSDLLDGAGLRGDECAVDLGCGRGAVLISLAKRLTRGRVLGIDLWRSRDQSGNDIEATKHNARACCVEDRVELNTGNITTLPYDDGQFDLVVSSLAIHNLKAREDRRQAITEAVRVLEPGGKIIIADISYVEDYADWLTEAGMPLIPSATRAASRFWRIGTHVSSSRRFRWTREPVRAVRSCDQGRHRP